MGVSLVCQTEAFDACWPELKPLVDAHHAERRATLPLLPLDVDEAGYAMLDAQGALVLVTMRWEGVLVGYTLSFVCRHLHAQDVRCALMDAYYVTPDMREGGAARQLFAATEAIWQGRGVERAYLSVPDPVLGRWVRHQGWVEDDVIYRKDL